MRREVTAARPQCARFGRTRRGSIGTAYISTMAVGRRGSARRAKPHETSLRARPSALLWAPRRPNGARADRRGRLPATHGNISLSVPSGRRHRHAHPHAGARATGKARADNHCGQPSRRGDDRSGASGRACCARRAYHLARAGDDARHGPKRSQVPALRSAEGFRADRPGRLGAVRARRQSPGARRYTSRVDRLHQEQGWPAELRILRRRHAASSFHGDVPQDDRRQGAARALPRQCRR
jgi:hypothetical protein